MLGWAVYVVCLGVCYGFSVGVRGCGCGCGGVCGGVYVLVRIPARLTYPCQSLTYLDLWRRHGCVTLPCHLGHDVARKYSVLSHSSSARCRSCFCSMFSCHALDGLLFCPCPMSVCTQEYLWVSVVCHQYISSKHSNSNITHRFVVYD